MPICVKLFGLKAVMSNLQMHPRIYFSIYQKRLQSFCHTVDIVKTNLLLVIFMAHGSIPMMGFHGLNLFNYVDNHDMC